MNIKVSDAIIDHCKNLVNSHNYGKRHDFNGSKKNQLTGVIGESVIKKLLGLPLIDNNGFDGGYDLMIGNHKFDIKTMGRNVSVKSYFTNNFVAYQDDFDVDGYIFCSLNLTCQVLTICGFISKNQFKKKRKYYPKGSIRKRSDGSYFENQAPLFEISNNSLIKINSINQLITVLNNPKMETKSKKVYLSNLKTIGQTGGLKGRIYMDKIRDHLVTDDKGREYIQFAIWPNKEPDQYGNSHAMVLDDWKPDPSKATQKTTNDLPF